MSRGEHLIGEVVWIELVEVARCYRITVNEIGTWIATGLVTRTTRHQGLRLLAAVELETIATLIRLTRIVGLDPETIAVLRDAGSLPGFPPAERSPILDP